MLHWSMKNDRELMQLARRNLSADQIATEMNVEPTRIEKVARRLGIRILGSKIRMTEPRPEDRLWTKNEDRQLHDLSNSGKSSAEIAQELKRSNTAVRARKMRLKRGRKTLNATSR